MVRALNEAKRCKTPVLVHVLTKKGKGYIPAEKHPARFHGAVPFDIETGLPKNKKLYPDYTDVFSTVMCKMGERDPKCVAITAAMPDGTGLKRFKSMYPDRFFDVGIAEEHAVTFCSGLSAAGLVPVFAVYSTFLQRCYDQIFHDAALQKRKMIFAVDRAGFVGSDGETHQGLYDISMLSGIPDITIYSPSSYIETGHDFYRALYKDSGVVFIRYPRGSQSLLPEDFKPSGNDFDVFGYNDSDVTVITYGRLFGDILSLAEKLNIRIIKLNKIKPLNSDIYEKIRFSKTIIFIEECVKNGSVGEMFASVLLENRYKGRFFHKAVDNCFVPQATVNEQMKYFGFDLLSLEKFIIDSMNGA
jgi:1-deoxy-D-xylulose-5-phosphate synthase